MIATAAAAAPVLTPARFARIVVALVSSYAGVALGREWGSMIDQDHDLVIRIPAARKMALTVHELNEAGDYARGLRTTIVQPGVGSPYEVVDIDGVVLGETRGVDAAVSIALDYVTAPLSAPAQHDHDAFAV